MASNWNIVTLVITGIIISLMPEFSYAQQDSDVGNFVCMVAENFEGNVGRGIATIGMSTVGVMALIGRIAWTQAIIVGVGVAVIFGAPALVMFLGSSAYCNVTLQ